MWMCVCVLLLLLLRTMGYDVSRVARFIIVNMKAVCIR